MVWLDGMSGYCKISKVLPILNGVKCRIIGHKQDTMIQAKLNRLLKRGKAKPSSGITEDKVKSIRQKFCLRKVFLCHILI